MSFSFQGTLPASKSILNRLLIVKAWNPEISWSGTSSCDDVLYMAKAIEDISVGKYELDCGEAGAVLRFLAFLVSRRAGSWTLRGSPRLMQRPQSELIKVLKQLGIRAEISGLFLQIEGGSWSEEAGVNISAADSSQFLSGLLLNAWNLQKPLRVKIVSSHIISEPYLTMTLDMVKTFGMKLLVHEDGLTIIPSSCIPKYYIAEMDYSSVAAVLCLAAVSGTAVISRETEFSTQADIKILDILKNFQVKLESNSKSIEVNRSQLNSPEAINFSNCPDLFPVVAALAANSSGRVTLMGAPQLRHKESDRISGIKSILDSLNIYCEELSDGLIIEGTRKRNTDLVTVDVLGDHRLVMAIAILKAGGWNVRANNIDCVRKSFPEFLSIARGYL